VPTCSADAVPDTPVCEVQDAVSAPPLSVPAGPLTGYYLKLAFADGVRPNHTQIFNNHIPLDPVLTGAVSIRKIASVVNVSRGQFVPYVITVRNGYDAPLTDLILADNFPPGFKYVSGSARINDEPREPDDTAGRQLQWRNLHLGVGEELTLKMLFIVGSGVSEGEYINRAQVLQQLAQSADAQAETRPVSEEATAAVRVVPDPDFDCTEIIGKVFDDANLNGYQDEGERGLAGVRLVTARGLQVTTDAQGRFHITCAVVPDENRGANFILKVDDRTLPTGYRFTTENPRVQRATRGKLIKFNFGAALHRVVGLDLADDVFLPGSSQMRPQWQTRLPLLMQELERGAAILRLAYMAETENRGLVDQRLRAIKRLVSEQWAEMGNPYELTIETEVFWRTGAPPARRSR
jgi:large repetitive protein